MPRDASLVRRNLFAIPGGLLTFYGFVGMIFMTAIRSDAGPCLDGSKLLVNGQCYNSLPWLLLLMVVGIALLLAGLLAYRDRPVAEGYLMAGTPSHFAVALLASFVVVMFIGSLVIAYVQAQAGFVYTTRVGGFLVKSTFIMQLLGLVAAAILAALGWALAASHRRRIRYLENVVIEEPTYPGEIPLQLPQTGADGAGASRDVLDPEFESP